MAKKIEDQSNAKDDAALPKRDKAAGHKAIADQRRREEVGGFEVGNDPNRPSHPNGWRSSR